MQKSSDCSADLLSESKVISRSETQCVHRNCGAKTMKALKNSRTRVYQMNLVTGKQELSMI